MGRFRLPAVSSRSGMEGILKGTEKGTGAAKAGIQRNLVSRRALWTAEGLWHNQVFWNSYNPGKWCGTFP